MVSLTLFYPVDLQLLGILFDIIGAYFLARSFIVKNPADIKSEVYGSANQNFQVSFSSSHNLFFSSLIQGEEARHGPVVLTGGFLLQGLALLFALEIPLWLFISALILVSIGVVASYQYRTRTSRLIELHDRDERNYGKRLKK